MLAQTLINSSAWCFLPHSLCILNANFPQLQILIFFLLSIQKKLLRVLSSNFQKWYLLPQVQTQYDVFHLELLTIGQLMAHLLFLMLFPNISHGRLSHLPRSTDTLQAIAKSLFRSGFFNQPIYIPLVYDYEDREISKTSISSLSLSHH